MRPDSPACLSRWSSPAARSRPNSSSPRSTCRPATRSSAPDESAARGSPPSRPKPCRAASGGKCSTIRARPARGGGDRGEPEPAGRGRARRAGARTGRRREGRPHPAGERRLRAVARSSPPACRSGLPPAPIVDPYTAWRALLTVSYEVDLFGRVSDTINATRSDYEANVATFRSVTLALQADVAQTYFALRATDDELRILRETVDWRDESVRLAAEALRPRRHQRARPRACEDRGRQRAHRSDRTRTPSRRARARARGAARQAARSAQRSSPRRCANELPAIPRGPAVDAARAASGHRGGEPADGRGQFAHRRREVCVFPGAHADRGWAATSRRTSPTSSTGRAAPGCSVP